MKIELPTSASEARIVGSKRYFTGKKCINGHISPRLTSSMSCCRCSCLKMIKKYKDNPGLKSKHNKSMHRKYRENNRSLLTAKSRNYRELKNKRMPKWANKELIAKFYMMASNITAETGIEHHVDHIVPLNGKKVCGLHVEYNLQIITGENNMKKGNRA